MNAVDGSDHYTKTSDEPPASLLAIILDTNPHAWALLSKTLPLPAAIANLLVFINAHLAINNANRVAILASHSQRAEFLYPPPPPPVQQHPAQDSTSANANGSSGTSNGIPNTTPDVDMADASADAASPETEPDMSDANHYRPFQHIQTSLYTSLQKLLTSTAPSDLTPTTCIAGALTLALTYINKQTILASLTKGSSTAANTTTTTNTATAAADAGTASQPSLLPRILILSVSGDLAHQYIPIMNSIFACQRLSIPIDICKIAGDTVFLQQASDATRGTYIKLAYPRGLLQYLMLAYLPDQTARKYLVEPNEVGVDFRAACFCHRRVVDVGFVCSICLSIFCSPPEGAVCLTCGTHLKLGDYGAKPVVVARKKKRKKIADK